MLARAGRIILLALLVVALLLALPLNVVWVRSYWRGDEWTFRRFDENGPDGRARVIAIGSEAGELFVLTQDFNYDVYRPHPNANQGWLLDHRTSAKPRAPSGSDWNTYGFRYSHDRAQHPRSLRRGIGFLAFDSRVLAAPHWAMALVLDGLAVACAVPVMRAFRRHRLSVREGRCPGCGYDLRASPDRCPECGRITDSAVT